MINRVHGRMETVVTRRARSTWPIAALSLTLAACGAAPTEPAQVEQGSQAASTAPKGKVSRFEADPRIGAYVSVPWGFDTSSYWIEGPDGLILIDTQFLPSAAAELVDAAEAMTHKKVKLAIVLHANPDKFNGTTLMKERGIRVVTSGEVLRLIPAIHKKRIAAFYDRYKPDYPREAPEPESFGEATTELSAGGVTVKAHVLGPGCSEAHVAVEFDGHLFVGDLVANGAHSWLEIGRTDAWLQRIDELSALKPRFVHPGRGPSGGPDLLDAERAYLNKVIELVAAEKPVLPAPKGAIERAKARIREAFPKLDYPVFLDIGIPSEWRRQAELAAKK